IREFEARRFAARAQDTPGELLDRISDAYLELDRDWRFSYVNEAAAEMFDAESDELLGEDIWEVAPEARDTPFYDHYVEAMETGEPRHVEEYFEPWDKWYEERLYPSDTGLSVLSRDVTERKRRERELREAERRYHAFFDDPNLLVAVLDTDGVLVDINDTAMSYVEASRDDVLGESFHDCPWWRDKENEMERLVSRAIDGEYVEYHVEHTGDDVKSYVSEGVVRPVERDGDVEFVVVSARDVTERVEREHEVQDARSRYRALVEAAPDAVLVVDAGSRRVVETNDEATVLFARSQEELLGIDPRELHPDDAAYDDVLEQAVELNGPLEHVGDGYPEVERPGGNRVPVSIGAASIDTPGGELVKCIYRDLGRESRYRSALRGLNRGVTSMLGVETEKQVCEIGVEVSVDELGLDGAALYLFDEEDAVLRPVCSRGETGPEEVEPGDDDVWSGYVSGETLEFELDGYSVRVVPVGGHGFLYGVAGDIDDLSRELLDTLAAATEETLDRVERSRDLRRERERAELQADELRRVHEMNEELRDLIARLLEAESFDDVREGACEAIAGLEEVELAWFASQTASDGGLETRAVAGDSRGYVDDVLAAEEPLEASVLGSREPAVEANVAASLDDCEWSETALVHGLRSAACFPVEYGELVYGAVGVYGETPGRFEGLTADVLEDYARLLGYALHSLEQREALTAGGDVELVFELPEADDVIDDVAEHEDARLNVASAVERGDDGALVYLSVEEGDVDEVVDSLKSKPGVREAEAVGSHGRVEVVLGVGCTSLVLSGLGVEVVGVVYDSGDVRATLSVPRGRDRRRLVEDVRRLVPSAELVAKTGRLGVDAEAGLLGLTDRQVDVLRSAFYAGYFDSDRKATGSEVADSLGISQPAFSTQLRAAERRLLEAVFGED
ncbi:MAG: PAS domain-containing protein, partial [Halobacteriota archaeon]